MTNKNPTPGNDTGLPDEPPFTEEELAACDWTIDRSDCNGPRYFSGKYGHRIDEPVPPKEVQIRAMRRAAAAKESRERCRAAAANQADMTLIDFARVAPADQTPEQFIAMLNRVMPLDELRNLTEVEAHRFFGAVSWLYDYAILLAEFHQQTGELPAPDGRHMAPCIPGSDGPEIVNVLTRGSDAPDFSQLVTFGLHNPSNTN